MSENVEQPRRSIELGLNLPYAEGAMDGKTPRWADVLAMAQAAESIGFEAVWISDHVGFGDPAGEWAGAWESWTLLSALAASTRRVALGPYVLAVPLRNPALLAKMAETLDEVSGGRLVLGVGAGWNEPEFTSYGVPFEDRFRRFEDGLRIVTDMLRRGSSTHDGRTIRTRGARLEACVGWICGVSGIAIGLCERVEQHPRGDDGSTCTIDSHLEVLVVPTDRSRFDGVDKFGGKERSHGSPSVLSSRSW